MYVASIRENAVIFESDIFSKNTATFGGALNVVTAPLANVFLIGNAFNDNLAWIGGGAIVLRNMEHAEIRSTGAKRNKAQFGGAILLANSAGTSAGGGIEPELNNIFEENEAVYGGALCLIAAGDCSLGTH